jgi:ATP-dependent DNA helicase DinG
MAMMGMRMTTVADQDVEQIYESCMVVAGRESRPGQGALVDLAVRMPAGARWAVKAPTATGKSLAALIAAGIRAMRGERVVIATYTKLLMDQYGDTSGTDKDLAVAQRLFGAGVSWAVLKGANNYLCRKAAKVGAEKVHKGPVHSAYLELAAGAGDPGELKNAPELWRASADPLGCRDHKPEDCGYAAAKAQARESSVVVTNHALVLINGVNAGVFGKHDLLIVDEIHNFAAAAGDFGIEELPLRADVAAGSMTAAKLLEVFRLLEPGGDDRIPRGDELRTVIGAWNAALAELPEIRTSLDFLYRWIDAAVAYRRSPRTAPRMALVKAANPARPEDTTLVIADIDIAPSCRRALAVELVIPGDGLDKPDVDFDRAVLMMSATVGTPGRKTFTVDRLGVEVDGLLEVPSPLNHAAQMRVSVIHNVNRLGWGPLVSDLVAQVGGRTLVLMRSWRRVDEIDDALRRETDFLILCQDREQPSNNPKIVAAFRANENSVLVGTRSFFEGIDLPGDTCVQVIVGDLPMPMVFSPLDRERQARIGLAVWHRENRVHETAIVLEQMIGRLIRRVEDKGVIAILDQAAQRGWGLAAVNQAVTAYDTRLCSRSDALEILGG